MQQPKSKKADLIVILVVIVAMALGTHFTLSLLWRLKACVGE